MSIPVKTNLMLKIKEAIEEITLIKKVLWNGTEFDRETTSFPWCSIFDEDEEAEERNRIMIKRFPLHIEVWIEHESGYPKISEIAETIKAELHNKLIDNKEILKYALDIKEGTSTKFYAGDKLGGIICKYIIRYAYARGDAYNPVRI